MPPPRTWPTIETSVATVEIEEIRQPGPEQCPYCGAALAEARVTRRTRTIRYRCNRRPFLARELRCAGCNGIVLARWTDEGFVPVDQRRDLREFIVRDEQESLGYRIMDDYSDQER